MDITVYIGPLFTSTTFYHLKSRLSIYIQILHRKYKYFENKTISCCVFSFNYSRIGNTFFIYFVRRVRHVTYNYRAKSLHRSMKSEILHIVKLVEPTTLKTYKPMEISIE